MFIIAVNPRPISQSNKIGGYPILRSTCLFFFSFNNKGVESESDWTESSRDDTQERRRKTKKLNVPARPQLVVEPAGELLLLLLYHPALEEREEGPQRKNTRSAQASALLGCWRSALMTSLSLSSYHDLCCYGAGIAGNIFAFVLFVSPLPTFRRIVQNGSTEQFSAMPYIYSLLSCLICIWYALPFVSYGVVLVATVNTIGAAFQLTYTAVFIAYADAKKRLKVSLLLVGVFCAFGLIMYVSMTLFDHKPRQTFVGYLSVASLICMFASPLSIINLVIKTKSVEYMPFYLSLSMSLMSMSFFAYGLLLDDFFIYTPNGIGAILGVIQLLLYAYFRKGSRDEDRRPLLVTHT